tara:strand:- start:171 stop:446 length:276 start_codon:yes stop_codon:yes gene_type:complete
VKQKRLILDVPAVCHKTVKVAAEYYGITLKDFIYHIVKQHMDQCAIDDERLRMALLGVMQASPADEFPDGYALENAFVHPHILPWHDKQLS